MAKYKQVKLNLTAEQYSRVKLVAKNKNLFLSTYIKQLAKLENCLDVRKPKAKNAINPILIYNLNKIGNNLNQIAKHININKNIDQSVLIQLIAINEQLQGVIK